MKDKRNTHTRFRWKNLKQ